MHVVRFAFTNIWTVIKVAKPMIRSFLPSVGAHVLLSSLVLLTKVRDDVPAYALGLELVLPRVAFHASVFGVEKVDLQ